MIPLGPGEGGWYHLVNSGPTLQGDCENDLSTSIAAGTGCQRRAYQADMTKFLLWCILLVLCWPLALLALVLYPIVWVALIPFRLLGVAVGGVLALVRVVIFLPARLLGSPARA